MWRGSRWIIFTIVKRWIRQFIFSWASFVIRKSKSITPVLNRISSPGGSNFFIDISSVIDDGPFWEIIATFSACKDADGRRTIPPGKISTWQGGVWVTFIRKPSIQTFTAFNWGSSVTSWSKGSNELLDRGPIKCLRRGDSCWDFYNTIRKFRTDRWTVWGQGTCFTIHIDIIVQQSYARRGTVWYSISGRVVEKGSSWHIIAISAFNFPFERRNKVTLVLWR